VKQTPDDRRKAKAQRKRAERKAEKRERIAKAKERDAEKKAASMKWAGDILNTMFQ